MSKAKKWTPVKDDCVRHRWVHPECNPGCPGDKEVFVDPSYYAESGTPLCGDCGEDYEYDGTEVTGLSSKEATKALREFVRNVDATGGIFHWIGTDSYFPVADKDWPDLAKAYFHACKALGRKPKVRRSF